MITIVFHHIFRYGEGRMIKFFLNFLRDFYEKDCYFYERDRNSYESDRNFYEPDTKMSSFSCPVRKNDGLVRWITVRFEKITVLFVKITARLV